MKSYDQVTNFIGAEIDKLSLDEQIRFLQRLIYQFVKELPSDWLDGELAQEKPHYQAIYNQIVNQTWQKSLIEDALTELDNIMFDMGDDYPHRTSEEIFVIMDMLGFYLSLTEVEQKSDISDSWTTLATIAYVDYADRLPSYDDEIADFENWLDYTDTAQAFENVENSLEYAKNI